MVIKGSARGGAGDLAKHLQRTDTNERMEVMELRGVAAENLRGALGEIEAVGYGTRGRRPFYHASINTDPGEHMTDEQWSRAIDALEKEMGLDGQPRAVVEHVKEGRQHRHIVWSRIDLERMTAIPDGHNYRRHEEVARMLEQEFGHKHVQGAHVGREGPDGDRITRPERTPSHAEMQQAERTGLSAGEAKAEISAIWQKTDSGKAFAAALEDHHWILARGDRRDFVVLDHAGEAHSLARRIEGAKAKDVRERMADVDPASLPSVEEARALQQQRAAQRQEEEKQRAAIEENDKAVLRVTDQAAARALAHHDRQAARPFTAAEAKLQHAFDTSTNGQEFAAKLAEAGLSLAIATPEDIKQLNIERAVEFAAYDRSVNTPARYVPNVQAGELVLVTRRGDVHQINAHKIDTTAQEARLKEAGWTAPGIGQVRAAHAPDLAREEASRTAARAAFEEARLRYATTMRADPLLPNRSPLGTEKPVKRGAAAVFKSLGISALGAIADLLTAPFAVTEPKTPEQQREDAKAIAAARNERAAEKVEARKESDRARRLREFTERHAADRAVQDEIDRAAARKRDYGGRELE